MVMYERRGDVPNMATLPDHIRTGIAQRHRQRIRCAQTVAILLSEPRMAPLAELLLTQGPALLGEDKADLNGTPGVRAAITVEEEAWTALARIAANAPACTPDDLHRAHEQIEAIKRAIEVQSTFIELAIPTHDDSRSLQALYDQYQQRYGA
jgi:hypothetical protein